MTTTSLRLSNTLTGICYKKGLVPLNQRAITRRFGDRIPANFIYIGVVLFLGVGMRGLAMGRLHPLLQFTFRLWFGK